MLSTGWQSGKFNRTAVLGHKATRESQPSSGASMKRPLSTDLVAKPKRDDSECVHQHLEERRSSWHRQQHFDIPSLSMRRWGLWMIALVYPRYRGLMRCISICYRYIALRKTLIDINQAIDEALVLGPGVRPGRSSVFASPT